MPLRTLMCWFAKRHLARIKQGEVFITKDLLVYGPRRIVGQILKRAANDGYIERLANGVYWKSKPNTVVPVAVIAAAKARAFNKELHGDALATSSNQIVFTACGKTTSFMYKDQKVILKGAGNCVHMQTRKQETIEEIRKSRRDLPAEIRYQQE